MKRIWIPQAVATVLLLWALNPNNPYAYYVLLRWICCALFIYLTVQFVQREKQGFAWPLGFLAALYNPILPARLNRGVWSAINILTTLALVISIFLQDRKTSWNI